MTSSQELPDLLGTTVDHGRLKFVEVLGSGAYGIVYKALDTSSPSNSPSFFAVKCVKKFPVGVRANVFHQRELKLHALVSRHPNVCKLHRYIEAADFLLIVLDYCEGGDLFHNITTLRRFYRNDAMVKTIFVQILDAVQYCHSRGVFHRDLKPENILCDATGKHIRLADFGLATSHASSKDYGLGSPYYISPEALFKSSNDAFSCRASDVWALGVILTNMISGRNPWRMAQPKDDCYAAYLADSDFLYHALPISREANVLLKRIFCCDPLKRPTIAQICEAVVNTETFFLTDEELSEASPRQQTIAEYYSSPSPVDSEENEDSDVPPQSASVNEESATSGSTIPDDVYLYEEQPFECNYEENPFMCSSPKLLAPPSSHTDTTSLSSSDASSVGAPVTPATLPEDPNIDVQVPDLPEDEGIGASAYFEPKQDGEEKVQTGSVFKKALRRISRVINNI
ncbi:Serine/threonine protein kinase [Mycena indigotica]|uniref:Serine/threonine protein kinase n=1 Tax=Mycena indigotica TaxID=2126181 RepID=A0A8H6W4S7_9AGAR|nr:Serine/threonine protein kinase [Mycena indigotica]KAF7301773.1 Serine/threonine protein kinase [Mycena indigotica]